MDPKRILKYRHQAVHELMRLNELCEEKFGISSCPRWEYDFDRGTLTFSDKGVAKVIAVIQVVGTTSVSGKTWMWGWANANLPPNVKEWVANVREFGLKENFAELTKALLPDEEHLGWEMTAIAAKIIQAKGAYRCPGENGYVYVVYRSIGFAPTQRDRTNGRKEVQCTEHEVGYATYVCEHLVSNPAQEWYSREPSQENRWPDAWCAACDAIFQEHGGWNRDNESRINIRLLCHHCYERRRSQGSFSVHDD